MKRKLLILVSVILMMVLMSGCNKSIIDFQTTFDYALVSIGNDVMKIEVSKWTDYEDGDQIQIWSTDGKVYLVNSVNTIMVKEK